LATAADGAVELQDWRTLRDESLQESGKDGDDAPMPASSTAENRLAWTGVRPVGEVARGEAARLYACGGKALGETARKPITDPVFGACTIRVPGPAPSTHAKERATTTGVSKLCVEHDRNGSSADVSTGDIERGLLFLGDVERASRSGAGLHGDMVACDTLRALDICTPRAVLHGDMVVCDEESVSCDDTY